MRSSATSDRPPRSAPVTCDPPKVFTYGGMINLGVTDLDAGDPMEWVAEPA